RYPVAPAALFPELNPIENVWEYLRGNKLSRLVWDSYEDIVQACCDAWNYLIADTVRLSSIIRGRSTLPSCHHPDPEDCAFTGWLRAGVSSASEGTEDAARRPSSRKNGLWRRASPDRCNPSGKRSPRGRQFEPLGAAGLRARTPQHPED